MKHLFFLVGSLTLLTCAEGALAAGCPTSAGALEVLNREPFGEYVKEVLKRADDGIALAETDGGIAGLTEDTRFEWIADVVGSVLVMVDTEMRQVEYSSNLEETTACLHADLRQLEAKMEEVRCELRDAVGRGAITGIFQLQSLLKFLNARYRALVNGATDPEHIDTSWQNWQWFDPPVTKVCCDHFTLECKILDAKECASNSFAEFTSIDNCLEASGTCFLEGGDPDPPIHFNPICPFHSDYWVPTVLLVEDSSGTVEAEAYGCDLDALRDKGYDTHDSPAKEEYEALQAFLSERDAELTVGNIQHIKDIYETMHTFAGKTVDPNIAYFGSTVGANHERIHDCDAKVPPNAVFLDLRGPFNFGKDQTSILTEFFNLTQKWAQRREFGDAYKLPSEIKDDTEREEALEREKEGSYGLGVIRMLRKTFREGFTDDSLLQGSAETTILPKTSDMQLVILETLKPVRNAAKKLYDTVVSPSQGFRGFAMRYALYLRASCVYRPCSERLDQILKIIFSDDCFPYSTGEYVENTGWEDCKKAVEAL